jgi:signal recognition particle receptor subunit beta
MSHINHKIIITGPVGSGKTTAITAISDIEPVRTDEMASDMTTGRKPVTTVAMDYGVHWLNDKEKIHIYGTPGQERFEFMWDILIQGGGGLILLLDNTRPTPFKDMQFYINSFRQFIDETRLVVGITQMDVKATPSLDEYVTNLRALDILAPVFVVDSRKREDVSMLIKALLKS